MVPLWLILVAFRVSEGNTDKTVHLPKRLHVPSEAKASLEPELLTPLSSLHKKFKQYFTR